MTVSEAFILGLIQGVSEFLPISSSGHLVIFQDIMGLEEPGNSFEILLHLGTLGSIITVFYAEIKSILFSLRSKKTQKLINCIIIGSLPATLIGLQFKSFFESLFENIFSVGIALVFTGVVLLLSSQIRARSRKNSYTFSFIIGLAQALAIIPGISRSGMTIVTATTLGFKPQDAARFSFFLAIPVLAGAGLLTMLDLNQIYSLKLEVAITGVLTSFTVGFISLKWLLRTLNRGKFHYFGMYCVIIGLLINIIKWI